MCVWVEVVVVVVVGCDSVGIRSKMRFLSNFFHTLHVDLIIKSSHISLCSVLSRLI